MELGLITDGKKSASPCKGKYYITDFVNIPTKSSITAANPDKQKRVEDVTIPQWISANVKILQKLMAEGMSQENVIKYLRYTSKIGDYLQTSDQSSVMLLLIVTNIYIFKYINGYIVKYPAVLDLVVT